jgi:hypothetical protein
LESLLLPEVIVPLVAAVEWELQEDEDFVV